MKRLASLFAAGAISTASAQNLYQNPGFETTTGTYTIGTLVDTDDSREYQADSSLLSPAASQLGGWIYDQAWIIPDGKRASGGENFLFLAGDQHSCVGQYFNYGSSGTVSAGSTVCLEFDAVALDLDATGGGETDLGVVIDLHWEGDSSDGGPIQPLFQRLTNFELVSGFGLDRGNVLPLADWDDPLGMDWLRLRVCFQVPEAPNGATELYIATSIDPERNGTNRQGLLLDNMSLTVTSVPEPSAAVMGLAASLMFFRRRRA